MPTKTETYNIVSLDEQFPSAQESFLGSFKTEQKNEDLILLQEKMEILDKKINKLLIHFNLAKDEILIVVP